MAMAFARTHKRAGKPVMEHQIVQLKLNEMHALTEALRSYVLRTAWEMDNHTQGVNAVLIMNWATSVIQRVTTLNMDIHAAGGAGMDAMADKLVRDGIIWTHLAGDASQRLKAVRRFAR